MSVGMSVGIAGLAPEPHRCRPVPQILHGRTRLVASGGVLEESALWR
jgi:hypothetical protein